MINTRTRAERRAQQGAWKNARISSKSIAGDDVWKLDLRCPGIRKSQKEVSWKIDDSAAASSRTRRRLAALLESAKQFVLSMALDPPRGRKRWGASTILAASILLRVIVTWMASRDIERFDSLTSADVDCLRLWIGQRRGTRRRDATIVPGTARRYNLLLKDLYRQRAKLRDFLTFDPFPLESAAQAAGHRLANTEGIPYIPDAIATDLLTKALLWIERYADQLIRALNIRRLARAESMQRTPCRRAASEAVRRALTAANLQGPGGERLDRAQKVLTLGDSLMDACFIVIAGFVGMRVSEILSMRVGAVETRTIEAGQFTYLVGRLYKGSHGLDGRAERWLAPAPVVHAVRVLERLCAPVREATGRTELFLAPRALREVRGTVVNGLTMSFRVNAFAKRVGVPLHAGKPWRFSTHQFRKTFARFVARRDRSNMLALSRHFKHVSIAMTARSYVGTDFELHELVDEESRAETAAALERMLSGEALAGRLGERITAQGQLFRGRAGAQVRKDYIDFVLRETDLRVHACDYGWCVFQAETARCGGEQAPDESARSPSACLSCANMVVDARHEPYWRDRRERNAALLPAASLLTRAALEQAIQQCDSVLVKLEAIRES